MSSFLIRAFQVSLSALLLCSASCMMAEDLTDRESHAALASLNQKSIEDVLRRNPGLSLYSLLPPEQPKDNSRVFKATFFTADSKQTTVMFYYIKVSNSWQRGEHISDRPADQQNGSK